MVRRYKTVFRCELDIEIEHGYENPEDIPLETRLAALRCRLDWLKQCPERLRGALNPVRTTAFDEDYDDD